MPGVLHKALLATRAGKKSYAGPHDIYDERYLPSDDILADVLNTCSATCETSEPKPQDVLLSSHPELGSPSHVAGIGAI